MLLVRQHPLLGEHARNVLLYVRRVMRLIQVLEISERAVEAWPVPCLHGVDPHHESPRLHHSAELLTDIHPGLVGELVVQVHADHDVLAPCLVRQSLGVRLGERNGADGPRTVLAGVEGLPAGGVAPEGELYDDGVRMLHAQKYRRHTLSHLASSR